MPQSYPTQWGGSWGVYTPTPWQVVVKGAPSRINSPAHLASWGMAPAFEKGLQVESLEFTGGGFKLVEKNAEGIGRGYSPSALTIIEELNKKE